MLIRGGARWVLACMATMFALAMSGEVRSDEVMCHPLPAHAVRMERMPFSDGSAQFDLYFPGQQGELTASSAELHLSVPPTPGCASCKRVEFASMTAGRMLPASSAADGRSVFLVSFREPGVEGALVTIHVQYSGVCTALMKVSLDPSDPSTWPQRSE